MRLIDNYVTAVGERLHASRRSAVEAELRASILDALEARGASPDSNDDVVAVLEPLGSPERMAAQYEPERGFLVGPGLFPHMRRAWTIALGAILVGGTIFYVVGLLLGDLAEFRAGTLLAQTLGMAVRALVVGTAVLVGVFALLQRSEVRLPPAGGARWDPRTLMGRAPSSRAPRFESAVSLVASAVVLLLLDGVGRAARDVASNATSALQPLASDVAAAAMVLQIALLLAFAAHVAVIVKGRWFVWTRLLRLVADGIAVVVFARAPFQLMVYRAALRDAGASDNVVNWLIGSAVIVAVTVLTVAAVHWAREWRRGRNDLDRRAAGAGVALHSLGIGILVLIVSAGCAAVPGMRSVSEGAASAAPSPGIVSPEVHADGSVTFRGHAPDAKQVGLVLESSERVGLTRGPDGVWSYTTGPLAPDLHACGRESSR